MLSAAASRSQAEGRSARDTETIELLERVAHHLRGRYRAGPFWHHEGLAGEPWCRYGLALAEVRGLGVEVGVNGLWNAEDPFAGRVTMTVKWPSGGPRSALILRRRPRNGPTGSHSLESEVRRCYRGCTNELSMSARCALLELAWHADALRITEHGLHLVHAKLAFDSDPEEIADAVTAKVRASEGLLELGPRAIAARA